MIKFAYTILYVKDVAATIEFYEKAFGFKRKFIAENNEYGELITGDTALSFTSFDLLKSLVPDGVIESDAGRKPLGMEVAFATTQVDQVFKKAISAGATAVAAPSAKPWGQTVAYVRDINGFLIEICTPLP